MFSRTTLWLAQMNISPTNGSFFALGGPAMDAGTATVQEELPCEFSSFPYSCPKALYTVYCINHVVSCRNKISNLFKLWKKCSLPDGRIILTGDVGYKYHVWVERITRVTPTPNQQTPVVGGAGTGVFSRQTVSELFLTLGTNSQVTFHL